MLWHWVDQTLQRQNWADLTSPPLISTPLKSFNCPTWRRKRDCFLPSTMSYTHRTPPHRDSTPSWVSYTTITVWILVKVHICMCIKQLFLGTKNQFVWPALISLCLDRKVWSTQRWEVHSGFGVYNQVNIISSC